MTLVHWPLMVGLLHLVQWEGAWAGPQPAQAPPRCTKCNSPTINGQCTNHRIAVIWSAALRFQCAYKGLTVIVECMMWETTTKSWSANFFIRRSEIAARRGRGVVHHGRRWRCSRSANDTTPRDAAKWSPPACRPWSINDRGPDCPRPIHPSNTAERFARPRCRRRRLNRILTLIS